MNVTAGLSPAPWRLAPSAGKLRYSCAVKSADGYTAAIAYGETPAETASNANLIAAAPDLLAVVKRAGSAFASYDGDNFSQEFLVDIVAEITAAIAKAEGRA